MPSKREAALMALHAALTRVAGAVVERVAVPEHIPPGGLLILRDGEPGEPEVTLSPLTYHYDHAASLEVLVQAAPPATRSLALDGLLRSIAAVLAADPTLDGKGGLAHLVGPSHRGPRGTGRPRHQRGRPDGHSDLFNSQSPDLNAHWRDRHATR